MSHAEAPKGMISADDLDSHRYKGQAASQDRWLERSPEPVVYEPRRYHPYHGYARDYAGFGDHADHYDSYRSRRPAAREEPPCPADELAGEHRGAFKDDWHTFPYKDTYRSKDFDRPAYKPNELHRSKRLPLDGADTWHDRQQMFKRGTVDSNFERNSYPRVRHYYDEDRLHDHVDRVGPMRRADNHDELPRYDHVIGKAKDMRDSLDSRSDDHMKDRLDHIKDVIETVPQEKEDAAKTEPVKKEKKTKLPDNVSPGLKSAAEMIDELESKIDQESKKLDSIKLKKSSSKDRVADDLD